MAERKLIERITDAVTSLRDPIPVKTLGDIESKAKASRPADDRPDFGQAYSNYYRGWNWTRDHDADCKADINHLDNSSLIMAIVNWTGVNLAEALPVVFKPDAKGVPQVDIGNPAADLIRRPNPFYTWADYCQAGAFDWWMGDWYMQKVRGIDDSLVELWYLPKLLVKPRWPFDGRNPEVPLNEVEGDPYQAFISHYQYNRPGKSPVLIKKSNMVHIKHGVNRRNPREGECVWESVLTEVYGDNAVARFSATLMKNMGLVRYFLSPKDKDGGGPNETQARAIQEQFMQATSGANAGKPLVGSGAMDVTKLTFSPQELDLKELQKEPQSRVAGVAGVPAILVQYIVGLQHGHYGAAYEQARQQGYESVIIPIQNHISEDLTWQVLPEIDKTKGARLGFDISKVRVLQEDRDNLYKRESEALRAGGITVDQFLTSIGKDALGSPIGDIRFVPSTSTPMSPERLIEAATTIPDPVAPIDPIQQIAKMADVDRQIAYLNEQAERFMRNADVG